MNGYSAFNCLERFLMKMHSSLHPVTAMRNTLFTFRKWLINIPIDKRERLAKRAGLFHFAILLPNRRYLANIFRHLTENSDKLYFEGAANYLVSESLYLRDPDSNGVEIYRDKNRSEWKRTGEFQVEMSTERMDLDQLYQEADNFGSWRMPENTVIGHVHLHVSNLPESKKFYSEILGLHHTCTFPGAYFFVLTYTITIWQPIHGLALIYMRLFLKD